ncbi:hypothetical protein [Enterococcus pallens]|uniref:Uncharacterized protein n=1 Tax=Enterococcus pallens ATCC BAA-351 TaxID=1158607 RepID=R2S8R3_9ENTE|nr:hypothetical protein [Enterococcus pallens]EOH91915.1 hypothetical protein UAU_03217 [Enterococcus pallens ATCC BAA-351]EOU25342.1 hypothetical protein I588_01330 [Enterococcus pallens ATCC BAA-351]
MTATIPADKITQKMQELINDNPASLLVFDQEIAKSQGILQEQQVDFEKMQQLNGQIKALAEQSGATIDQIKQLKKEFNQVFESYKKGYAKLKEIALTIKVSYETEAMVTKHYLFKENEKIMLELQNSEN